MLDAADCGQATAQGTGPRMPQKPQEEGDLEFLFLSLT